ncbi:MAG: AEC family transporter [Rhodocyclaceae bacterium]|nr:AEC family transporter [Rhodocyclaceae bacterium]
MLARIVAIVFPVFAIIGAGYAYALWKRRGGGGVDMAFANQLNMDVFVPALVFAALSSKSFDLAVHWKLALAATVVVLGSGLLAWPLARLLKEQPNTFVPPMMFTNSGNMGLPLAVLAFGEAALPAAVVLFFVENTLHYLLGTWMLDHHARLRDLWKVPVNAAALAGLAVSLLHVEVWPPLHIGVKMLGDVAIPLLLFSLGVRLATSRFSDLRLGLIGAIACPVSGMALAWIANAVFALEPAQAGMLLVFGALPPAVLNYVFAERYQQEPAKVASLVMVGNVAALAFVPLALAIVL